MAAARIRSRLKLCDQFVVKVNLFGVSCHSTSHKHPRERSERGSLGANAVSAEEVFPQVFATEWFPQRASGEAAGE